MACTLTAHSAAHNTALPPCILLPGWSMGSAVFTPLLPLLRTQFQLYVADYQQLPPTLDALADALAQAMQGISQPATLLGWSLGGNLALALAQRQPQRVRQLCLLHTNPSFRVRDDAISPWPCAMAPGVLDNFTRNCTQSPAATLKVFDRLQAQGAADPKAANPAPWRRQGQAWTAADLVQGLAYLDAVDQRPLLAQLPMPQLWLWAEQDALVPASAAAAVARLAPTSSHIKLPGASHFSLASHAQAIATAVMTPPPVSTSAPPLKNKIAQGFSQAASSYNDNARIQRWTAEQLLAQVPPGHAGQLYLDIGCGTGRHSQQLAAKAPVLALDLAEGMVRHAHAHYPALPCAVADAEQLPLPNASVDGIFSSLAVQWCADPAALLREWQRVLRPGGQVWLSTLLTGSLREIHQTFASIDQHQHANHFFTAAAWQQWAAATGLNLRHCSTSDRADHYPDLRSLLLSLKSIGANTVVSAQRPGLLGKHRWQQLVAQFEAWRSSAGLPLSYHIAFFTLVKP